MAVAVRGCWYGGVEGPSRPTIARRRGFRTNGRRTQPRAAQCGGRVGGGAPTSGRSGPVPSPGGSEPGQRPLSGGDGGRRGGGVAGDRGVEPRLTELEAVAESSTPATVVVRRIGRQTLHHRGGRPLRRPE